jgi:tRNA (guanine-N7-)-methyltransferase
MTERRPDPPPVRTFKPRRRPLSASRAALVERLAPTWMLDESGPLLDLEAVFGRRAPVVLEIGIGAGEALTAMAGADPATDLIGVEVHTPGVAAALERVDESGLRNVRLVAGDALVFLERVTPGSLTGVRLFFPDPWPKARHRHRRMVAGGRLRRLVDALGPDGWIHIATDIDEYAVDARRACDADDRLTGGVIPRPEGRPMTRYERKGCAAGRSVTDLLYRRTGRHGPSPLP